MWYSSTRRLLHRWPDGGALEVRLRRAGQRQRDGSSRPAWSALLLALLAKRWGIQQAARRPERVQPADEVEGAQIAVEDFPIIAHLAND
jgi:hypothetical protein